MIYLDRVVFLRAIELHLVTQTTNLKEVGTNIKLNVYTHLVRKATVTFGPFF